MTDEIYKEDIKLDTHENSLKPKQASSSHFYSSSRAVSLAAAFAFLPPVARGFGPQFGSVGVKYLRIRRLEPAFASPPS